MKVTLAPLEQDSVPSLRGAFYVRDTKYGPRAQAWPRPGAYGKTTLQQEYRTRFGFAAVMAANPTYLDYETAVEMSKGTQQVPRDILTMAALGRYYILVMKDGTILGHVEGPTAP